MVGCHWGSCLLFAKLVGDSLKVGIKDQQRWMDGYKAYLACKFQQFISDNPYWKALKEEIVCRKQKYILLYPRFLEQQCS